jgi:predicted nucleic acid-binding protein
LSPQVLQEFYVNVTRKIAKPLSRHLARAIVEDFRMWCIDATAADIATARILSEDFNAGQSIAGVRIEIPSLEARHEQSF